MTEDRFAVIQGGKQRVFKIIKKMVNIPGFGVMSAEELAQNASAISYVMSNESFQCILEEGEASQGVADPKAPSKAARKTTKTTKK